MTIALSRRAFIQASLSAAGGLAIALFAPAFAAATTVSGEPWGPESGKAPDEVNGFFAFLMVPPGAPLPSAPRCTRSGAGSIRSRWPPRRPGAVTAR